jgi:hypothetical protein
MLDLISLDLIAPIPTLRITDGTGAELENRKLVPGAHALSVLRAQFFRMQSDGWELDGPIDESGFRVTRGGERRRVLFLNDPQARATASVD